MNQTRRQFFKTLAAAATAVVVAPAVVRGGGSDRSVVWGKAEWNIPVHDHVMIQYDSPWKYYFYFGAGAVMVKTTESITAGQALVWNPDGTVRGA